MAANLNKVLLIGNLTRDPDMKSSASGTSVTNFGLAINRIYTNANGEKVEDVCYVDVVVWDRLAEVAKEYLSKGRQVLVEGRLHMHRWVEEGGQKRSKLEVVAQSVQFLGRKSDSDNEAEDKEDYK